MHRRLTNLNHTLQVIVFVSARAIFRASVAEAARGTSKGIRYAPLAPSWWPPESHGILQNIDCYNYGS
jgi:hypothetical protein